jgi:hypothetical protein
VAAVAVDIIHLVVAVQVVLELTLHLQLVHLLL